MKGRTSFLDVVRLIRFAVIFWVGDIVILVIINQSFPGPQRMDPLYYVSLGCIAILCLYYPIGDGCKNGLEKHLFQ
jgi:hypothetical protein